MLRKCHDEFICECGHTCSKSAKFFVYRGVKKIYACNQHKNKLPDEILPEHHTEADYQTWMKL